MNDMIVGMENLPNVFIKKITLNPINTSGFEMVVLLEMYDSLKPKSWYGRIDDLKIKVTYDTNLDNISSLNSGAKSLFSYVPASVSIIDKLVTKQTKVLGSQEFSFRKEVSETRNSDVYCLYQKEVRFMIPPYDNLSVYAACFVDNLNFQNPEFKKYYGPMAAESIIVGGAINTLSRYFYYPDTNLEYGGPVHEKPNGTFMEGSMHSTAPHRDVVLVEEENHKIILNDFNASSFFDVGVQTGLSSVNPLYAADSRASFLDEKSIALDNTVNAKTSTTRLEQSRLWSAEGRNQ